MAKTKRKIDYRLIHEILTFIQIFIGIFFIILIFSPVIGFNNRFDNNNYLTFSGCEIIFNYTHVINLTNTTYYLWGFSFLNMLPYIFILTATILNVIKFFKNELNNFITNIIITCLFIISSILIINCINLTNFTSDFTSFTLLFGLLSTNDFSLAYGSIMMCILGLIGSGLTLSEIIVKLCEKH